MSVRQHILATLAVCLTISLVALLILHVQQQSEADTLAANFAKERGELLAEEVREQSSALGIFVQDYSGWDDMVNFTASLDPEWARLNLEEVMPRYRLDAVWLVAPDGRILYSLHSEAGRGLKPPPAIHPTVSRSDWTSETGGFYRSGDQVVDMRARPVQPTADTERKTRPVAWLFAGRLLGDDEARRLGRKLQAEVTIHPPHEGREPEVSGRVVVHHPLLEPSGTEPVAEWHAAFDTGALDLGVDYNDREMVVWIVSVVLVLGVLGWTIHRNVLRPLAVISRSLENEAPASLDALPRNLAEFARISDLVRESFRQRQMLRGEIAERIRLGRDLHDGVIQNLYATGMGIAHGMKLAKTEPEKAIGQMSDTLRTLNETIDTLRSFIVRAESEATGPIHFADDCISLFQTLRVQRDCELDLDVAPDADASLPAEQKAHLLFIVRETISNALRLGEARRIGVSLKGAQSVWRLTVSNVGKTYDFTSAAGRSGLGLANLRARAMELGGAPHFVARPGGGVDVSVEWRLSAEAV